MKYHNFYDDSDLLSIGISQLEIDREKEAHARVSAAVRDNKERNTLHE